jgi:hypothetical protein
VKRILALAAVTVVALVICSSALANGLTCAHGPNCQRGNLGGGGTNAGGTLPFTGLDLAGIAGVGALLLASGLTLHRVSRRRR